MESIDEKNMEILDVAHTLFTRFGYRKTTMEDIGKEIGLNQASLYHYFRNKEDIYLSVIFNRYTEMKDTIRSSIKENMNLEQKLFELFKQKFIFFEQDPLLREIFELNITKISQKSKERILVKKEEERTILQSFFQNAIDNKEIPQLDIQPTIDIIIRLTEGIRVGTINQYIAGQRKRNLESMLSELQLALNYLVKGFKAGV
jgi:AcrR family transcriptional regulator